MKRMLIFSILVLSLSGGIFFACSNDKNKKADLEKGTIEKITDKVAKEAVDKIRTPIEKARSVKNQQADRYSVMDESLNKQ